MVDKRLSSQNWKKSVISQQSVVDLWDLESALATAINQMKAIVNALKNAAYGTEWHYKHGWSGAGRERCIGLIWL